MKTCEQEPRYKQQFRAELLSWPFNISTVITTCLILSSHQHRKGWKWFCLLNVSKKSLGEDDVVRRLIVSLTTAEGRFCLKSCFIVQLKVVSASVVLYFLSVVFVPEQVQLRCNLATTSGILRGETTQPRWASQSRPADHQLKLDLCPKLKGGRTVVGMKEVLKIEAKYGSR